MALSGWFPVKQKKLLSRRRYCFEQGNIAEAEFNKAKAAFEKANRLDIRRDPGGFMKNGMNFSRIGNLLWKSKNPEGCSSSRGCTPVNTDEWLIFEYQPQ